MLSTVKHYFDIFHFLKIELWYCESGTLFIPEAIIKELVQTNDANVLESHDFSLRSCDWRISRIVQLHSAFNVKQLSLKVRRSKSDNHEIWLKGWKVIEKISKWWCNSSSDFINWGSCSSSNEPIVRFFTNNFVVSSKLKVFFLLTGFKNMTCSFGATSVSLKICIKSSNFLWYP